MTLPALISRQSAYLSRCSASAAYYVRQELAAMKEAEYRLRVIQEENAALIKRCCDMNEFIQHLIQSEATLIDAALKITESTTHHQPPSDKKDGGN